MSRFREAAIVVLALAGAVAGRAADLYPGVGRDATAKEVAAWDIDVRPDFKGLPPGAGSVARGQEVWEGKCASCHGIFADSGEVFTPLVGMGGIGKDDIKTGHVARLTDPSYPSRTTFMKVATLSTIWDYINRAMPWTAPKSLSTEEVYAVTAYLLNLAGIVPDDFTLSERNIREVQQRMPNRNGMTTAHAMWPGPEFGGSRKPDTHNAACMKDCPVEAKVVSMLPDYARNAHGNLADQNRLIGAQHGSQTAPRAAPATPAKAAAQAADDAQSQAAMALLRKNNCLACHALDRKVVGPGFQDVAKKHAGKVDYLAGKIRSGGSGVWGAVPMPPQSLNDADARAIAQWLAAGAAH